MNRIAEIDPKDLRNEIRGVVELLCDTENPLLNHNERQRLVNEILDETFGFGPLELLLKDGKIGDIMINGPRNVFVEKEGKIQKSEVRFRDNDHLLQIIDRIVSRVGRRVDETSPMVDARLPDGSRFNAIIPPLALDGPVVTIRMFGSHPLSKDDLLRYKAFTPEMLALLEGAMKARLNIIISGGTGSGKTTLLNTLSSFIQPDHRVITIEDAAELQLQQDHVVRLETRPCNIEGRGAVTATDLVRNALRMRPDRIIIGECRGAETLDMIQAMNTGHEGSMTTVVAAGNDDQHGRIGVAHPGIAGAVRFGRRHDRPGQSAPGRPAQSDEHLRSHRHGGRHDHHAGDLCVSADRSRRKRSRSWRVHCHRHPAQLHGSSRTNGVPSALRPLQPPYSAQRLNVSQALA
jgi:pilus assembly protein CpaF